MDNVQCQVFLRNRVSAPELLHACGSSAPSRCKRWFRSCGCALENFVRVPRLSFLYNLGEPIRKVLYSWDFQSPSYALQSVLQLPWFHPGLFQLQWNNLKLLNAFLFTPTLLNARIKVCYCKNEIFASSRADSVALVQTFLRKVQNF